MLDVPFTFDHVGVPIFARFFGLTPADQPMADMMHAAMVAFVGGGAPRARAPTLAALHPTTRLTMVLDASPVVVPDLDRIERLLWAM